MKTLIKPTLYRRSSLTYAFWGEWGADWVHKGAIKTREGGLICYRDVWECEAQKGIIDWCSPVGAIKIDPPFCPPPPPPPIT